jgi:hypothetical protein
MYVGKAALNTNLPKAFPHALATLAGTGGNRRAALGPQPHHSRACREPWRAALRKCVSQPTHQHHLAIVRFSFLSSKFFTSPLHPPRTAPALVLPTAIGQLPSVLYATTYVGTSASDITHHSLISFRIRHFATSSTTTFSPRKRRSKDVSVPEQVAGGAVRVESKHVRLVWRC